MKLKHFACILSILHFNFKDIFKAYFWSYSQPIHNASPWPIWVNWCCTSSNQSLVLGNGESFKAVASDKSGIFIRCKGHACGFRIQAHRSKGQTISITRIKPHSCSPATHYKSKQSQSVHYLMPHHRAAVIDNRIIAVAQIRSAERLQWSNY